MCGQIFDYNINTALRDLDNCLVGADRTKRNIENYIGLATTANTIISAIVGFVKGIGKTVPSSEATNTIKKMADRLNGEIYAHL